MLHRAVKQYSCMALKLSCKHAFRQSRQLVNELELLCSFIGSCDNQKTEMPLKRAYRKAIPTHVLTFSLLFT